MATRARRIYQVSIKKPDQAMPNRGNIIHGWTTNIIKNRSEITGFVNLNEESWQSSLQMIVASQI